MASSPQVVSNPPPISHPAYALLARAHSPDTVSTVFTEKVKNRPLLLQPTTQPDNRAQRRHIRLRKKQYYLRKRKPQPLSAKEKRQLGVYKLQKEEIKYEIYKGLHQLWNDYMLEVLGFMKDGVVGDKSKNITVQGHGSFLASADFHGAEVEVVRSKDVGKVGIKGIVVRDTKFTFVVVTERNEVKTLPKKETLFRYAIGLPSTGESGPGESLVFELHGSQFEIRPAERANRKFKWRSLDYL